MSYTTARKNEARFRSLTGVGVDTFDTLLPYFADTHDEYFRWHTVDGRKRSGSRPHTIQRNSPLPGIAERLYFVLVYLKQNAIQELIAELFGMTQTQSTRVRVEHHIGSAKILKVIREECRLRKNRIVDGLFHTGAAIHNLRNGFKLRY